MSRKRFCPGCGDEIEQGKEFCINCKPIKTLAAREIYFLYCEKCKNYNFRNKWKPSEDEEEAVTDIVLETFSKEGIDIQKVKIPKVTMKAGVNVDFSCEIIYDEVEYEVPGRFLMTICPKCAKDKTCYFEGILQLRNPKEEVKDYILKRLDSVKIKGIHASDVKEVTNGIDYHITSKSFLRKLGRELKTRFKGDYNESPELFSRNHQTSKDIWRINVLFRCHDEKKEEVYDK